MPSWTWGVYLEELPVSCAGGQGCVDGCDRLHDQDVQAEGHFFIFWGEMGLIFVHENFFGLP